MANSIDEIRRRQQRALSRLHQPPQGAGGSSSNSAAKKLEKDFIARLREMDNRMDSLEPAVKQVEGGWQLVLDQLWPIVTCRTRAAADAVASLLPTITALPEISPASLTILAGFSAGQCVSPNKNRPLSMIWTAEQIEQYYQQYGQPAFQYGGLSQLKFWLACAGQCLDLRNASVNQ